jgi:HAMP domain-containing protein
MSLRLTFNLVLGVSTLVGILLAGWLLWALLQDNAREEVLDSARIMMQSALAVRGYTVEEVRPLLAAASRERFLPQTVPAYAAHRYVAKLQREYPDFSYREATLNPTNPADRATEWEADVINWFRNRNGEQELIGQRDTPTGPSLFLSRPIKITDAKCLACHTTPAEAPASMVAAYGDSNGFGWKLWEVVGAQVVSVPMSLPLQRAQETFRVAMALLVGVFLVIVILLNVLLHFMVVKPIKGMSSKANEISMGALDVEEIKVSGSGEIAVLGQSFNRMHRSLTNAVEMLNETMDQGLTGR